MSTAAVARRSGRAAYDVARDPRTTSRSSATKVHGKPLVYLDNAATAQKPPAVIDAEQRRLRAATTRTSTAACTSSRAAPPTPTKRRAARSQRVHQRAASATRSSSRAAPPRPSTWWRRPTAAGTSEPGDEILITGAGAPLEHRALADAVRGDGRAAAGRADRRRRRARCSRSSSGCSTPRTKLVAVAHVSNALGTINPVQRDRRARPRARRRRCWSTARRRCRTCAVDVQALDCDFYAFSGHKIYGPTGIGVLYGKAELLEAMPPWQGGGDMIRSVTFEKTTYNELPVQVRGRHAEHRGRHRLRRRARLRLRASASTRSPRTSTTCSAYAHRAAAAIPGLRIIGTAREKAGVLSFVLDGVHPHDIGTMLDHEGIAVRTGHHCAQPVMDRFGVPATARASFGLYNTREEVDALVRGTPQGQGDVRADVRPARAVPGSDPRPQQASRGTSARCRTPTARPRATTRCAATARRSTCELDGDVIEDVELRGHAAARSRPPRRR